MSLPTVRIVCFAPSASSSTKSCGYYLGHVPGRIVFAGAAEKCPAEPDGRIWVQCPSCHTWNSFALVPDGAGVPEPFELRPARPPVAAR